jgi:hypothetical protein
MRRRGKRQTNRAEYRRTYLLNDKAVRKAEQQSARYGSTVAQLPLVDQSSHFARQ